MKRAGKFRPNSHRLLKREEKRKAWTSQSKNLAEDPKQETEIGIIDHFMLDSE